ncbi:hypothetical protein BASA60_007140 [Batrachochytrium salamandrivorans]|nr:hypothetical protein BASA60_007140 [Batrachochytrium salamandrivorans]
MEDLMEDLEDYGGPGGPGGPLGPGGPNGSGNPGNPGGSGGSGGGATNTNATIAGGAAAGALPLPSSSSSALPVPTSPITCPPGYQLSSGSGPGNAATVGRSADDSDQSASQHQKRDSSPAIPPGCVKIPTSSSLSRTAGSFSSLVVFSVLSVFVASVVTILFT